MSFVAAQLENPCVPATLRQDALDRVYSDPGIPNPYRSTLPFWLREPHPSIAKCQSKTLPAETEVVVIGSGITGTSVAKTLLESCQPEHLSGISSQHPKVVMLEARDICSGATGRNGGHILETGEDYAAWKETYGQEAAMKLVRFRLAHLDEIIKVAEEFGIREYSQARKVQFVSAYFDDHNWSAAKEAFDVFKKDMPVESSKWLKVEGTSLSDELLLPRAKGAILGEAGAIWPYRFVTGVLSHLRQQYSKAFRIESNTPAEEVIEKPGRFLVRTPRGTIRCKHVVHCTNAHTAHLLPQLQGRIFPIRGQMSAQTPGEKFPGQGSKHSWTLNYDVGYDYLTQLPIQDQVSNGEMMLGGGFAQIPGGGVSEIGISTDSNLNFYADMHLSGALSAVFGRENWGRVNDESVKSMWTGNMGFSADGLPWVGKIPRSTCNHEDDGSSISVSSGAEWISAAFSGEGMVNAWLCGRAAAFMILQHETVEQSEDLEIASWFPEQMLLTAERLQKVALPRHISNEVEEHEPHHNLKRVVPETSDNRPRL